LGHSQVVTVRVKSRVRVLIEGSLNVEGRKCRGESTLIDFGLVKAIESG
jgi:predicted transcriptional regulator with HTH domain